MLTSIGRRTYRWFAPCDVNSPGRCPCCREFRSSITRRFQFVYCRTCMLTWSPLWSKPYPGVTCRWHR